jgi:subtilisin-like proprotein convertase family protein
VVEQLEGRTMLAVLPAPVVSGQAVISRPGDGQSFNSPSIAYDPLNPLHLVTVFGHENPGANGRQHVFIRGTFSTDGGLTWGAFNLPGNVRNPAITGNGSLVFEQATDPTVGFDRLGQFYVSYSEHDADYSAGNVVVQKYDFTGGTPQLDANISNVFLYKWVGADAVYHPTMAVDGNIASFTDPATGEVQVDTTIDPVSGQGPIYVGWSTDETPPPNVNGFNPNSIEIVASADGGTHFSATRYVNDGDFFAGTRNIMPRLTISQGTMVDPNDPLATPRVRPGQLGIVWDDFFTLRNGNPPLDQIWFDRVEDGGGAYVFDGATGDLVDAVQPDPAPDVPTVTTFRTTVNIAAGVTITDLNVNLTLRHPDVSQISVDLIAPDGTVVPLVLNRTDMFGQPINPLQGLAGQDLGFPNVANSGTVFDQEAANPITAGVAPYVGSFQPETGDLSQFYPLGGAALSGTWLLQVTDYDNGPNPLPAGTATTVVNWSLNFARAVGTPFIFQGTIGNIGDAVDVDPDPAIPGIVDFTTTVSIPAGTNITDFDVLLTLRHPDLSQLLITLTDPNGTVVPLVLNGFDLFGQPIGNNPQQGITGVDLGWLNGVNVGTQFDQETPRAITDGAAPYLVSFRPDTGDLSQFYQPGGGVVLDGDWTLEVTDFVPGPTPLQQGQATEVVSWGLKFSFGLTTETDSPVATTRIRGSTGFMPATGGVAGAFPLAPIVAPDRGIAASPVLASDNTLGSFSPFQGRLYVAYTGRLPANGNPTDNTDIFLAVSDDGGLSWFASGGLKVNDDLGITDGFSEAAANAGRPQFMPSAAVDPVTGTLVVSYYDARYDASRARVGQFISTSIDGGSTFGKSTFANIANTALDAVTGNTITLGPVPDNQSSGAANRDTDFGFGLRQGLVVFNGKIHPAWAGNRGLRAENSILTSTATIAAGPRIISNTMGPVSGPGDSLNPADADGTPRAGVIQVQFDRIIDPSTFTPEDVTVIYRDPNTSGSDPGTRVPILSVMALDLALYGPAGAEGATRFSIIFDTSLDPDIGKGTGTYSYMISPDISDRIRSVDLQVTAGSTLQFDAGPGEVNLVIPPVGTGGSGNPANDTTISTITIAGIPLTSFIFDVNVNVTIQHTFDGDLVLTLVAPDGTRVPLAVNVGGPGEDFLNTVFDDSGITAIAAGVAPFTGSFIPDSALSVLAGGDPNGIWSLEVEDTAGIDVGNLFAWSLDIQMATFGTATFPFTGNIVIPSAGTGGSGVPADDTAISTVTITATPSNQIITDLNVNLIIEHPHTNQLEVTLIAPDGTRIPLALARGDDADFGGTIFDDQAADPISAGTSPFVGSFQPESPLDVVNGLSPNGTWTLEVVDTVSGEAGMLVSASLEFTLMRGGGLMDQDGDAFGGEIAQNANANDSFSAPTPLAGSMLLTNPDASDPYVYFAGPFERLTLPLIVPGPHVVSSSLIDRATATGNQVNLAIPPVGSGGSGVPADDITLSTITINAPGALVSDLIVNLTLTHALDSDLVITLIAPNGTRILLSDHEGATGQDFINTTFDDQAADAISVGVAPFTGSFQPEESLGTLGGMSLSGIWTLEIEDTKDLDAGTLVGWSLVNATSSSDNLALNRTVNSVAVTFDRDMDPASFTPSQLQRIVGPTGLINGPRRYNNLDTNRATPAGTTQTLLSPISISDDYTIGDMDIRLFIAHGRASDLVVTLIAPDGTRVPLLANVTGAGADFQNTLLDDSASASITTGAAPFNRVAGYKPLSPLSAVNGLNIKGTWQLEVIDNRNGITGTLNAWSMIATPALSNFTVTPIDARTFAIGFPTQKISGTYAISLDSSIKSVIGEQLDENRNAGVERLFGISSTNDVSTVNVPSTNVPQLLGDLAAANKITTSTITVPDAFLIQDLDVQLNISYPRDTDLRATLIGPDGTRVILFDGVGIRGTTQGFINTIFDDSAATPIQNGGTPFFGRFNPQESLNNTFLNTNALGTWTLEIVSTVAGRVGTLNSWSITFAKPAPNNGLGEVTNDDVSASFRIFTQDPANPLSHDTITAVGPAPALDNSGRIGGIAIDPSDPSGNTVFVAGASGGIWKTTNFLTDGPLGPTWVPLTDFGPTFSLNMGSVDVFGRNHDPNQSIIFGATGEANAGSSGVGFIRSMDGGATWTLLDSTVNVDANGNPLPISSPLRDHIFLGSAAFKVSVDPRPTPSGEVVVYAALVGNAQQGGIWRSVDTGKHWQQMLAGDATDVLLDFASGVVNAVSNPTGNVDIIYGALRGDGVYISPNRGGQWNKLDGGFGNLLIRDSNTDPANATVVNAPGDVPSGPKGRILLARPHPTGNPVLDIQYESWLYVVVVNTASALDGLYVTKDMGQNWTKVHIASTSDMTPNPSNDPNQPDYPIFGRLFGQGNYDAAIDVDFNNPSVLYLAGKRDGSGTRVMRIDMTGIADPHALFVSYNENDGGQLRQDITAAANTKDANNPPAIMTPLNYGSPITRPTLNLLRNPLAPFLSNATLYVDNVENFANTGTGATWIAFDGFLTTSNDSQRMAVMRDPVTGGTRIILGNDHQVASGVDTDGVFTTNIGTARVAFGARTGNLQTMQFYYGASQPSFLAADIAGAMFYGNAQDDGTPTSISDPLSTGFINWIGGTNRGDAGGVATDQQGSGTLFSYRWPCCGGGNTDFFQVNGVGRTFGLLQAGDDPANRQGQWPLLGTVNFTVNPVNSNQIIISSSAGRIFGTTNQGIFWLEIGNPAALDGTQSLAQAFGAPAVGDPTGALNNFMYVGTNGGGIFVTFNGGGVNGNSWMNLSAGLDGSAVQAIVTNPLRGSHEAYAVTSRGVYFIADSSAINATWVNITGNIFTLTHNSFGDPNLVETQLKTITALAADWRYFFPDTIGATTHPVLFVGGEGGVYRSLDKGVTWSLFPDTVVDGGPVPGGFMPNAHITDLDLALGNVDPTNGQPDVSTGPDVLLVTTYGRGSFAVRMAPIILPGSVQLNPSNVVNNTTPTLVEGISAPTAFGNTVRITLVDLTDPANPVIVGGYDGTPATDIAANWTDSNGRFSVLINSGAFTIDGTRTIGVHASDESGTTSNDTLLTVIVDTTPALVGTGGFTVTGVEGSSTGSVTVATFTDPGPARPLGDYSATIDWGDGSTSAGTITFDSGTGVFTVAGSHVYDNPGAFVVTTQITRAASIISVISSANVSNPSVILTGGFVFSAGRLVSSSGPVATFSDPGGPELVSAYVATINWGDGTATSTGTITLDSGTGIYTVTGTHSYATVGSFTITVTLAHTTATSVQTTSTANVAVPGVTVSGGLTFTAAEGATSAVQTVATFVDPNGAGSGTYTADIDWGDGTTSAGTITQSGVTFTVRASHLYTEEGSYTIRTTVHRTGAADGAANSTANVSDVAVVASGGLVFNAPRGLLSPVQTVATFIDPAGPEALNEYAATINWGDGQSSSGTITLNAGTGVFSVAGAHLYALDGTFTITVTISHATATPNAVVTSTASVQHPPLVVTGGFTFTATEGQASISQPLATFIDPIQNSEPLSSYSAQIAWGDGTTSAALITLDSLTLVFTVMGSHTYQEEGTQTITVTIKHSTASPDAVVTATANIADPAVVATGGVSMTSVEATAIPAQKVATFTDPGGPEALADYSATIDWGDGTTSAGTITFNSTTKVFTVSGGHTYSDDGIYTIATTIHHDTAPDATAISTANITNAPVAASGGFTRNAVEGTNSGSLVLATFTDPGGPEAVGTYSASIAWGDSSTSAGTITFNAGVFTVSGSHVYGKKGSFTAVVTIGHGTAPTRTAQSTVVVANAAVTVTANALTVNEGVAFNGVVGAFVDANSAGVAGNFTATINWGDGTANTTGTITVDPLNSSRFIVNGTHTYADGPATRTLTMTIRDNPDAENFSRTAAVTVNNVKPVASITAPTAVFRGFAADFAVRGTDASTDTAAGFKYVINWGDGTAAQTIARVAGNDRRNVSHTFASNGTFNVTVRATDKDGAQSDIVSTSAVVISPPTLVSSTINSGNKQRSRIKNVAFTLSANAGITKGDLKLTRVGVNVSLAAATFTWNGGTKSGNLDLSNVTLADGNYRLAIDTGGGVKNIDFFRLAGDANGDRKVNASDLTIVNNALGTTSGQTGFNANADLNVDGKVDSKDKAIVNKNQGHTLSPP